MKNIIITLTSILILLLSNPVLAANTYYADFENTQYASIADASETGLDGPTDFTIEAWVWVETFSAPADLIFTNDGAGGGYALKFTTGPYLACIYRDSAGNTTTQTSDSTITTGSWQHFACTAESDTKTVVLYVNGSNVASTQTTTAATQVDDGGIDSGLASNASTNVDMRLDEVRVWDDIRTPTEISDNYDCGLDGTQSNLAALWKLENDWLDETSNNNDLTAYNSPTFGSSNLPFSSDCVVATSTPATSTIEVDLDWYSDDLTIIKGRTDIYTDSTTTPSEIRYHFFHIPFLAWVIIFSGIFIIGSRIILEIIIRFRNGKLR